MRKLFKYILPLLLLLCGCQEIEIPNAPSLHPGEGVYGEALVSFSIAAPEIEPLSKAAGMAVDPEIHTLHLIIFDEMGTLIETRKASLVGDPDSHEGYNHNNERNYEVILTLTDSPRRIHFIANCPMDQISMGNESEIIANLYVTKKPESDGYETEYETAYWGFIEVDEIILDTDSNELTEHDKFVCVPLLRNFSRVTVVDGNPDDYFTLESFAVYNTINVGTVAPYNKSTQSFQMFSGSDGLLSYDQLLSANYEGHALARVVLDPTLTAADFITAGTPYFMYERRISVRTSNEEMWDESPSHIIIKGQYKDNTMTNAVDTYYKIDLIRTLEGGDNQYYNILRNFAYRYTIKGTYGRGYDTFEEAKANPAGNNLSGSTDTQGFTNISDGTGRIFVSYTDKTLVSNKNTQLKVKYIPNITTGVINNNLIDLRAITGNHEVLLDIVTDECEMKDDDGWMILTFAVQKPGITPTEQEIQIHVTDNPNLHRTIRYTLRMPYQMTLTLADNTIDKGYAKPVQMTIQLPDDLPDNLFPMDILIETDEMSLSPNSSQTVKLPVHVGPSIVPGKNEQTYQFVYSIVTYEEYLALKSQGYRITTDWYTSVADIVDKNATIYVANEYFDTAKIQYTINN